MDYNTGLIAARIKNTLKDNGGTMRTMLTDLNMNINAISELAKGKQLSCVTLAKVADYLNCSTDYLLGRTDTPEINK